MNQAKETIILMDSLYVYKNQEAVVTERLKEWFRVRRTMLLGKDPRWSATKWKMLHCRIREDKNEKNSGAFVCMVSWCHLYSLILY